MIHYTLFLESLHWLGIMHVALQLGPGFCRTPALRGGGCRTLECEIPRTGSHRRHHLFGNRHQFGSGDRSIQRNETPEKCEYNPYTRRSTYRESRRSPCSDRNTEVRHTLGTRSSLRRVQCGGWSCGAAARVGRRWSGRPPRGRQGEGSAAC